MGTSGQLMPRSAQISASSTSAVLARRITRPIQKLRVYQQQRGAVGSGHRSCDIVNHNLSLEDHINLKYADNQID
jgi:hypothetical protein